MHSIHRSKATVADVILDVQNLHTEFRQNKTVVRAVNGLTYQVNAGEAVAIVGESGSGKSVGVRSLLKLIPRHGEITQGKALFKGRDLLALSDQDLRAVRGKDIAFIFQDAMTALNPTMTLKRQLTEHLLWHGLASKRDAVERAIQAMTDVGLDRPEVRLRQYPFQLSGGMRQRAMIAMAMASRPSLLIADEPTTALDVTLQRQILDILKQKKQEGMSIILITHDLGVARYFCDRVIVMYAGRAVERASMAELLADPAHPYSRGLLDSTLEIGMSGQSLHPIPGNPPNMAAIPAGCPFAPRCPLAEERCRAETQELKPISKDRDVACWKVSEGIVTKTPSAPVQNLPAETAAIVQDSLV
jgi:oligopeptide/dipeptide ABC transporter ATP-binding protein